MWIKMNPLSQRDMTWHDRVHYLQDWSNSDEYQQIRAGNYKTSQKSDTLTVEKNEEVENIRKQIEELQKEMQVFSIILLIVLVLITLVGVNQYSDYAFVTFGFTLTWIIRSLAIKYFS